MTDEPTRDDEVDVLIEQLEDAGLVEQYTNANGQPAMRLTRSGEQVARQLAMMSEDEAAALIAALHGETLEEDDA